MQNKKKMLNFLKVKKSYLFIGKVNTIKNCNDMIT